jgi:hypothetical protein
MHPTPPRETRTFFSRDGPARTRPSAAAHRRGINGPARARSSAAAHRRGIVGNFISRATSTYSGAGRPCRRTFSRSTTEILPTSPPAKPQRQPRFPCTSAQSPTANNMGYFASRATSTYSGTGRPCWTIATAASRPHAPTRIAAQSFTANTDVC